MAVNCILLTSLAALNLSIVVTEFATAQTMTCDQTDDGVLSSLLDNGADLTRQREAVFYFYGPAHRLPELQIGLERLGFAVRPTRTDLGLVASVGAVVNEDWIATTVPQLCKMALDLNIEYDGWEASIPEAMSKGN